MRRPSPAPHLHLSGVLAATALVVVAIAATAVAAPVGELAPGDRVWAARYDGPAGLSEEAYDLKLSPDGSTLFVTGDSWGDEGSHDYATVAYDAVDGDRLWESRHTSKGLLAGATALDVSPDGSTVVVTGSDYNGRMFEFDYTTIAYNAATGARRWASTYNGSDGGIDLARAVAVSPDGSTVFVTGASDDERGGYSDFATVAFDTDDGAQLWVTRYRGPGGGHDSPNALTVSPDGSTVFVTGEASAGDGPVDDDYGTVAYDAGTGDELWVATYNGPGDYYDVARALTVTPDGSAVFVTGESDGIGNQDSATVAYDAITGARLWVSRYDGPGHGNDYSEDVAMSPDGSVVFVTGKRHSEGPAQGDYATVAYDAETGSQRWVAGYNGPVGGPDIAYALRVSPDGSTVFVTGSSHARDNATDYATVAYEAATGRRSWVTRARAPGYDSAIALVVSPSGATVYVTGSRGEDTDYGTIAYEA
jgi:WD40 repeat protein